MQREAPVRGTEAVLPQCAFGTSSLESAVPCGTRLAALASLFICAGPTLAESFASPALAVSIDTGHARYAHGSTGAAPVDFYVTAAGNRLQHVHIQDADGYADRHWEIGRGTVNWHAVFGALARLESRPRLILELRDKAAIPASVAWLEAACRAR
ncbi:TIM barrel protein [Geminicoccaceae bacterium 1502E]|nr:TIM barrel protein [Geminicoccaceae bacterium 1502E]